MRISPWFVALSLAVASSVNAVPAPLQKRNAFEDELKALWTAAIQKKDCGSCVAALVGVKDLAYLNQNWVLDAVNDLCPSLTNQTADVCSGLVYSQGPTFLNSLISADITGGDGKQICFQTTGACPAPAISSGTLTFPKPRPANTSAPAPNGTQVDILHLSDWHVDDLYVPGSEAACNKPMCCRKYADSPVTPTRPASSWGDFFCDSPLKLGQDLLKYVPSVASPNFVIMTGDIPPHDVWLANQSTVVPDEAEAYAVMATLGAKIYPTVGNHEAGPPNLFPTVASGGNISWLYDGLAQEWSRWLPPDAVNSVKNYGAYTTSPQPGFRIISLNTNFCYTLNFYLYAHTDDYDPNGMLNWLITQLQAAEDAKERVWIIGHVGPSQTDCIQNWSALYYQVIQRYSPHVVAEQFFGHTHYDEFALFYNSTTKNAQTAISTSWIGPSVTPYVNLNPGFRVYKVDAGNWNIYDSLTYVADLNQAAAWDAAGSSPNWHLEYSARQAYGAYVPVAANQPLSASWWHQVTMAFESNSTAFQQYWTYRGKSANMTGSCEANTTCPADTICNLRAGNSSDTCSHITFSIRSSDDEQVNADVISGLRSHFKRAPLKPWDKKLCGGIFRTHTEENVFASI
ncbi:hypothetical protein BGZ99_005214 [Dissophora globulifera]|uniref:Sphingomyelin phosphodiesterase n=1 Tax=Dissophora globulifera TaxID=979702 RepID=A0A9P6UTR7_9FUNG|nr:hypothetical protein BGZ99_005214 [Dissophora globulifera]